MNHFMARLIFCFFAEDTDIFLARASSPPPIEQMSARDSSNTHEVIGELFRAMNTKPRTGERRDCPAGPMRFPMCNGGLVLRQHGRAALQPDRALLSPARRQSRLDEDQPRHLRLDDPGRRGRRGARRARHALHQRAEHPEGAQPALPRRPARASWRRPATIPASCSTCASAWPASGSSIRPAAPAISWSSPTRRCARSRRRSTSGAAKPNRRTDIPLTNFRGIELRDFPAEIARLALIIAEYQCDVLYRGQKLALAEFLPLAHENWITCGNALRLDWLSICPPTGTGVKSGATGGGVHLRALDQSGDVRKAARPTSGGTGDRRAELHEARIDRLDVEGLLGFAEYLLGKNAGRAWMEANLEQRQQIQSAIFPEGLPFDGRGFGTARTCLVFKWLEESRRSRNALPERGVTVSFRRHG